MVAAAERAADRCVERTKNKLHPNSTLFLLQCADRDDRPVSRAPLYHDSCVGHCEAALSRATLHAGRSTDHADAVSCAEPGINTRKISADRLKHMADTPTAPTTSPQYGHQRQCIHMRYTVQLYGTRAGADHALLSSSAFAKDDPKALRTHNLAVSALLGTPNSCTKVVLANWSSQLLMAACAQLEPRKAHRTPLHDRVAYGIPVSAHRAHTCTCI